MRPLLDRLFGKKKSPESQELYFSLNKGSSEAVGTGRTGQDDALSTEHFLQRSHTSGSA